jgi:hypothetical protein
VNSTFTAQAADRLYQMLRLPGLHARFTTWLQPDLYPMDVIYIGEQSTGAAGVAFYVMQTINNWEYVGGRQVCTTTVLGKFLL